MKNAFYTVGKAEAYFDRFGWLLALPNAIDTPVYKSLYQKGDFDKSTRVFEIGAGLGAFSRLCLEQVAPTTTLVVTEISGRLQRRLEKSLHSHRERVQILSDPGPVYSFPEESFDRVVACFVLDMMDETDQRAYIAEANRLLVDDGYLCLLTVCDGVGLPSRVLMRFGKILSKFHPWLTLGARYSDITHLLKDRKWNIVECKTMVRLGCATRLTIARKESTSQP